MLLDAAGDEPQQNIHPAGLPTDEKRDGHGNPKCENRINDREIVGIEEQVTEPP